MASLSGITLGKYQINERLGRGGMAEVYKAYHPQLERFAAIKVLHGFLAEGQDFQMRFQREAKAIAALRHPNIVQIYDIDIQDENYYMVMEYIDGGTLKDRLIQASGPLPINAMANIFRQIASALDYAHHQGVLHRDVKPANVLLDESGRAVLTDFGIARIVSETQFTVTGTLVGTPAYMSPEQGKGVDISAPSDIYSLGIILYEMVTGKVPFDADTPLAVIHKHINEPLPSPRSLRDDIPGALENVILKALAKEADERFQTAGEMLTAAEEAFREFEKLTLSDTLIEAPDLEGGDTETEAGSVSPERMITPEDESKETVAMEYDQDQEIPDPQETFASKPTVTMEPDAEAVVEDIAERATVAMEPETEPVTSPAEENLPEKPPSEYPPIKPARKTKPLTVVLSVVGVLVVALVGVFLLNNIGVINLPISFPEPASEGEVVENTPGVEAMPENGQPDEEQADHQEPASDEPCDNPDACHEMALEMWNNGDIEAVIGLLELGISKVPDDEHPRYAHLWCERGEAMFALDRPNEAIWSYEDCIAWTEDNPDQEEIRAMAQEQIDMLSGIQMEPSLGECASPDECFEMSEMLRGEGDFGGALAMLETGIPMVTEEEMAHYHFLMCSIGEVHLELQNWDGALAGFEGCIAWTRDDPGLEGVRAYAQEQIDSIINR